MVGLESSTAAVAAVAAAAAAASQLATIKDAAQRSTLAHCPQVPHACFSLAEDNGAPGGGLPQPVGSLIAFRRQVQLFVARCTLRVGALFPASHQRI